ncbi:GNAT family N-acetyltransferase [Phenylobacterium sp.]|uniref:GNAT family N-acetyltransferase n=1 Tax=Phenylobacterium sp. TaxID=1871053 RepID=UPI002E369B8F|nr:GNAT family N-acetyltransferase [Phenylobacterium sp.]HEX4708982.1 GNAT family N-acetyltransferase [Phenylobacterium sp.]
MPQLVDLMRRLAVFEDYLDAFAVTEAAVIEAGLGPTPRFGALVADDGAGRLLGMAVHYVIPWTFDLRPTLVLKELFVVEEARGKRIGAALIAALIAEGHRIGASRINWTVMAGNHRAEAFYTQAGGEPDRKWLPWSLQLDRADTARAGDR